MSKQKYPQSTVKTADGSTQKKGRDHYSSEVIKAKRKQKRMDAEERQARYDAMPLSKKIAMVKARRGESKRELARLEKLASTKATPPPAPPKPQVKEKVQPKKKDK